MQVITDSEFQSVVLDAENPFLLTFLPHGVVLAVNFCR